MNAAGLLKRLTLALPMLGAAPPPSAAELFRADFHQAAWRSLAPTLKVATEGATLVLSADTFNPANRLVSALIPYDGGPLRIQCRARAEEVVSRDVESWERAMVIVDYFNRDQAHIQYQGWQYHDSFGYLVGTSDWTDLEKTVDIPARETGVAYLRIELCLFNAKGSFRVENLTVSRPAAPAALMLADAPGVGGLAAETGRLQALIARAEAKGLDCREARVSLAVGKRFQVFIQDDLAAGAAGPPAPGEGQALLAQGRRVLAAKPPDPVFLRIHHQFVDPAALAGRESADAMSVCQGASRELQARVDAPDARPAWSDGPEGLRISGGAFLNKAGTPVFLFGFNFDGGSVDAAVREALGANTPGELFGGAMAGNYLDPARESPIAAQTESMARKLREHPGVPADFLFQLWQPASIPGWLQAWSPSPLAQGNHFSALDPDNPRALDLDARIFRQAAKALAPFNGTSVPLVLYDLHNEPRFQSFSALSLERFRQWLKGQYQGDLGRLNRLYGTAYADFAQVQRVPDGTPAQRYDWLSFNQERVTELFMGERTAILAQDPRAAIHLKLMPTYWEVRDQLGASPDGGISHERLEPVQDAMGIDQTVAETAGDYAMAFQSQGMTCDFLKSIAPGKPILDSEWHGINGRPDPASPSRTLPATPEYVSAAVWHAALHGVRGMTAWYWSRYWDITLPDLEPAREFARSLLTQPRALDALGRTWLRIRRLGADIVPFAQASSPVRLFHSEPSRLLSATFRSEFTTAYEGADFLDAPVRMLTDAQARKGMAGVGAVLVPPSPFLGEEAYQALLRFARAGGRLVVVGAGTFGMNERGEPRSTQALRGLPGVRWLKGAVRADYAREYDRLLDEVRAPRPLRVAGPAGVIECRTLERGGTLLAYLINLGPRDAQVTLRWAPGHAPRALRDLVTGRLLPPGPVTLGRCGVLLLAGA